MLPQILKEVIPTIVTQTLPSIITEVNNQVVVNTEAKRFMHEHPNEFNKGS